MSTPRTHPRYEVRLSAAITTAERSFTATTRNLSAGGCCLESAFAVAEDSDIQVDLFVVVDGIEDERMPPLSTHARVQWTAETDAGRHAAGVQFHGMTPAQVQWLETFLAKTSHA